MFWASLLWLKKNFYVDLGCYKSLNWVSAEIFPRDKRSISRRGAGLEWQRLREQCATTVTRGSIMNAIQFQNAIVQRTGIECFEITFHEAKFIANIISSALFHDFIYFIIHYHTISLWNIGWKMSAEILLQYCYLDLLGGGSVVGLHQHGSRCFKLPT